MRVNPVFQSDDAVVTQVARIRYPLGSEAGSSQVPEQATFHSVENIHVSIEVKSKAYISYPLARTLHNHFSCMARFALTSILTFFLVYDEFLPHSVF